MYTFEFILLVALLGFVVVIRATRLEGRGLYVPLIYTARRF